MEAKYFDEAIYTKMLDEVGESSYRVFDPEEELVRTICPHLQNSSFKAVCISTGDTVLPLVYENYEIPAGSQILVERVLRYCQHDGFPHLNADDYLYFHDKNGNVWRVSGYESPDHYIYLAGFAGLKHIAQAYHLPQEKVGPSKQYVENGALMPIRMDCPPGEQKIKIEYKE